MDISKDLGREISPSGQVNSNHAWRVFILKLRSHNRTGALQRASLFRRPSSGWGRHLCGRRRADGRPGGATVCKARSGARTGALQRASPFRRPSSGWGRHLCGRRRADGRFGAATVCRAWSGATGRVDPEIIGPTPTVLFNLDDDRTFWIFRWAQEIGGSVVFAHL